MTAPTGAWIECDGGVPLCTAWLGIRSCMADATHEWRVPGRHWDGTAACPEHLDLALHGLEEDSEPSPPSDAATLAEARRLAPLIDDLTDVCPYCWHPGPGHGRDDDCPLCDLLDLLTKDGA